MQKKLMYRSKNVMHDNVIKAKKFHSTFAFGRYERNVAFLKSLSILICARQTVKPEKKLTPLCNSVAHDVHYNRTGLER